MKKLIAMLLALVMVLALAACGGNEGTTGSTTGSTNGSTTGSTNGTTQSTQSTNGNTFDALAKDEGTMTYAEYMAAELDSEVVVECFVQATQGWWDNKIVVYAQDPEGAYFMYNMECSEEDSARLVPGTKIKVTGFKAAYKGEVEIIDCTFEIMEGTWIAEATDVTELLDSADLINYQNMFVAIQGASVAPSYDANGNKVAFLYNWNGSGEPGSDLYFNINVGGKIYNMCVESYLCGDGTAVYDAVEALNIGDVIDLEGFLYWYDGVNPHITNVTVKGNVMNKAEGTMTYAEYAAAEMDTEVVIECYVQATQGWWDNKIVVYAQDMDGAYFMYNMECSEEDSAKLVPGAKIRVTGFKAAYKGEVEVIDCTFEVLEGTWIAPAFDVTNLLASADLINYQNMFAAIKGAKVVASVDANGNEVAFLYNWNGSGVAGNDLYFNIEVGGVVYNMCVESYLCGDGTAVYDAVEALNIGDVINLEGFLYWYDGVNPHITSVEVVG